MKLSAMLFGTLCFVALCLLLWLLPPGTSSPPPEIHLENHASIALDKSEGQASPGYYQQWFQQKKNKEGFIPNGMFTRWHEHDLRRQKEVGSQRTNSGIDPILSTQFLGPHDAGGRTRAILVDASDPDRIFAGGVSGGLWRSEDRGGSWTAINDAAVNLSVTSITQNPFNPAIIYYGTGEVFFNSAGVPGEGIFKSINGGQTFYRLLSTANNPDFEKIYKVEHDLLNSNTLYVGTRSGGCYRTLTGGLTWTQVHPDGKVQDIVCLPDGSVLLGIYNDGIYRSPDGSPGSFVKNTDSSLRLSMRRIEMANSAEHPYTVYAGFEGRDTLDFFDGFYKSTDGGITWATIAIPDCGASQDSYNLLVGVHPTNPDTLMAGAYNVKISLDGGTTWEDHRNPHQDIHAFAMHSSNPDSFLVGNDGGIHAFEWATGSPPVRYLNNGYAVTQFYGGGPAATGSVAIGGTQDNGTWKVTDTYEDKCGRNDGGFSFVHQQNPNEAYQSWQGYPSTDGPINLIDDFNSADATSGVRINNDATMNAEEYDFINYYEMSYFDSDQLYVRTKEALWRTLDQGANWDRLTNSTITGIQAIGLSYESDPVAYFGGRFGIFYRIDNAATTPQGSEVNLTSSLPAAVSGDHISSIAVHPMNKGIVYVSFGNNGDEPRLYKVTGALTSFPTWLNISGNPATTGLPEGLPVNFVQVHPQAPDEIFFAGTDFGLYYTVDGGVTWYKESSVPNVAIFQMKLRPEDHKLFLFTHGRGVWEVSLIDCTPIVAAPGFHDSLEQPFADGWNQPTSDDFDWIKQSGGTSTPNTGPWAAADGTYYTYVEASAPNNPEKEAILVSPCFDLSGFNTPKVSWKYHMYGGDVGTLWVDISTNAGLTWNGIAVKIGDQGNIWHPEHVNLYGYEGETNVKFRFRATTGTGQAGDIAIDDFWLSDVSPRLTGSSPSDALNGAIESAIAFPNPFESRFQVMLPESVKGKIKVKLFDLSGKLIQEEVAVVNGNQILVETNKLPQGNYFAHLKGNDFLQFLKVIKR